MPPRLRRLWLRLVHAFRPDTAERDLAREVASHLALLEDAYQRLGKSPADARTAARRAMGGVEQVKIRHRDVRAEGATARTRGRDLIARMRGRATTRMTTDEIMRLMRG